MFSKGEYYSGKMGHHFPIVNVVMRGWLLKISNHSGPHVPIEHYTPGLLYTCVLFSMNVACILLSVWERLSMYLEEEERKKLGPTSMFHVLMIWVLSFGFQVWVEGILFKS